MKLKQTPCYWDNNLRHNYRRCTHCFKVQYNYSGTWEDKLTFEQFAQKWSVATGNGTADLIVETGTDFELWTNENWNRFLVVSVLVYDDMLTDGKWVKTGKMRDWNHADVTLRKLILPNKLPTKTT